MPPPRIVLSACPSVAIPCTYCIDILPFFPTDRKIFYLVDLFGCDTPWNTLRMCYSCDPAPRFTTCRCLPLVCRSTNYATRDSFFLCYCYLPASFLPDSSLASYNSCVLIKLQVFSQNKLNITCISKIVATVLLSFARMSCGCARSTCLATSPSLQFAIPINTIRTLLRFLTYMVPQ